MNCNVAHRCLIGIVCFASAQTASAGFNYIIRGGLDVGGDEIARAYFTNGSNDKINAGELVQLSIGGIFGAASPTQPGFETELTIGWKFDTISGKNGHINWDRFPLEALEFYRNGSWRYGGGLTYHMNPKLTSDGVASNIGTVSFDNALGAVGEMDYITDTGLLIGGRVTLINYKVGNQSANGNSIGFTAGYRF